MFTGLARVSRIADFRSIVSLQRRTLSSAAELWMVTV
jgi:hypothetical protein